MNIKKQFINEDRGIVRAAIPYTKAILNSINKQLDYYFEEVLNNEEYLASTSDMRIDGYLPLPDYSTVINIPYRTLAKYITDDDFEEFPVVTFNIDLKFAYVDKEPETDDKFGVGGGAWPIYAGTHKGLSQRSNPEHHPISKFRKESIDKAITGKLDFDLTFYQGFDPTNKSELNDFYVEVKAVVFHEILHLYEFYKNKSMDLHILNKGKRQSKKPKSKGVTSKANLNINNMQGIPKELTELMTYLFHLYYVSLPIEVRAITHEIYPFILEMPIDEFFESYQGKRIRTLMEFDLEDFYELFVDKSNDYFQRKGIEPDEESMKGFFEQIRMRTIKQYKTTATNNHEVLDDKLLNKKDFHSLIKYMGKQINKSGQKLFKNVGRLYSLKSELN